MSKAKAPTGSYAVGYGKPPKAHQFKPGQSGNPKGRPKGQPTTEQLLLEEASRLVKVKVGDAVTQISKQRALLRKLLQLGMEGNVAALRLTLAHLGMAEAAEEAMPPEAPLTEEELAVLKLLGKAGS